MLDWVVVSPQLRSPCTYRLSIHNDHELINTENKKIIDFINKQIVTNIESDSFTQNIYLCTANYVKWMTLQAVLFYFQRFENPSQEDVMIIIII